MHELNMMVMNGPDLTYSPTRGGHSLGRKQKEEGRWNLVGKHFNIAARSGCWSVLHLCRPGRDTVFLDSFFRLIREELPKYGLSSEAYMDGRPFKQNSNEQPLQTAGFANRHRFNVNNIDRKGALSDRLRGLFDKDAAKKTRLVFVILPEKSTKIYQLVKSAADLAGIHTICHVSHRGWSPTNQQVNIGNMLMKFNLKMQKNTVNQAIRDIDSNDLKHIDSDTMLMGMDVTHPPVGAKKGAPSIAALVGSVNDEFSQFPAVLRENPPGGEKKANEEIRELKEMVTESVKLWMKRHPGKMPKRIIAFRDGLSEAQLQMCKANEIPKIEAGIEAANPDGSYSMPELFVICTVKRHHVRFFGKAGSNSVVHGPDNNPLPGAMVDQDVVLNARGHDFFLVSHQAIQGTARPCHYIPLKWPEKPGLDTRELARMVSDAPESPQI
jgi:eukaryotic translation initiation factor 2C